MLPPLTPGQSAALTVGTTSAALAIPADGGEVELQNVGSSDCFVALGDAAGGAATAAVATGTMAANCYPVGQGQSKMITVPIGCASLAAICAAGGSTTLYVTFGQGC
jgi:hypothetical protein